MLGQTEHHNQLLIKVALTQKQECNYLPNEQEQLFIVSDNEALDATFYQTLLELGFRRSGNQVYRPNCINCQQCQSLRLPVQQFHLSKSQRRILKKNLDLVVKFTSQAHEHSYELFKRYVDSMHKDGGMYPANTEQYNSFANCNWLRVEFMEIYLDGNLIAVGVMDPLPNAISAVYFYYDPDYQSRSLGTYAILMQIEHLKSINKECLYLGYQIDACAKMNYKSRFLPHQRLLGEQWQSF